MIINDLALLDELTILLEDALSEDDIKRINKIIYETLKGSE